MPCKNCAAFRSAVLHARMAEAVGLAVGAFKEKFGLAGPDDKADAFAKGGVIKSEPREIPPLGESGPEAVIPKPKAKP